MDHKIDDIPVDYLYPHKTPYSVRFETDTWIMLTDLNDDNAASIMDSADWVIASLRICRGILQKRVYFDDAIEGLLELTHNGEELSNITKCTETQKKSMLYLIEQEERKRDSYENISDTDRR